jgi:hypothetical protein
MSHSFEHGELEKQKLDFPTKSPTGTLLASSLKTQENLYDLNPSGHMVIMNLRYILITLIILSGITHTYFAATGVRKNGRRRTLRTQMIGLVLTIVSVGFLSVF